MQKHMSTMQHNKSSRETTTKKVQQETYVMRLEGCKPKRRQLTIRKFIQNNHQFEGDCAHESAIPCKIKPEISKIEIQPVCRSSQRLFYSFLPISGRQQCEGRSFSL
jgi:hypothetical protein